MVFSLSLIGTPKLSPELSNLCSGIFLDFITRRCSDVTSQGYDSIDQRVSFGIFHQNAGVDVVSSDLRSFGYCTSSIGHARRVVENPVGSALRDSFLLKAEGVSFSDDASSSIIKTNLIVSLLICTGSRQRLILDTWSCIIIISSRPAVKPSRPSALVITIFLTEGHIIASSHGPIVKEVKGEQKIFIYSRSDRNVPSFSLGCSNDGKAISVVSN